MGTALSHGSRKHVISCIKHYALNSMENMRFDVDVLCDEATLRECYLPHFRHVLESSKAESVMAGYNHVNGVHCSENGY
jgi:beta-glucosidase